MLALPAGSAAWSSNGGFEPDNKLDSATLMWTTAPGTATNRVYFNGFAAQSTVFVWQGLNPNVAALETRNEVTGNEIYLAVLGVWTDCNGDGYIGMAETAAREYESALLLSTAVCPPMTGGPHGPAGSENGWPQGYNNYNGWVTELIPIGGSQPNLQTGERETTDDDHRDRRIVRDHDARVWGDYGRPDAASTAGGGTCPVSFPRGTFRDTGGLLNYFDCFVGSNARWNQVWGEQLTLLPNGPAPGPITVPLVGDPLELRFDDSDDARTGPLGQHEIYGDDSSSNAAVATMDCSAGPLFHAGPVINSTPAGGSTLNGTIHDVRIWTPGPAVRDTSSPTIAGQVNQTNEDTEFNSGGCDPDNEGDNGRDVSDALGEEDFDGVDATDKRQSTFNMVFQDGSRGDAPFSLVHGGSAGMNGRGPHQHEWSSTNVLLLATPGLVQTRIDIPNATANPGPAAAAYISFYAFVGSSTTGKGFVTPGGSGKYGSGQCGSFTSGVHNGWQCDASLWYMNADGTPMIEVPEGGLARPGATYNLRDVDCADGSNNLGVPTQTAALGEQACVAFGS